MGEHFAGMQIRARSFDDVDPGEVFDEIHRHTPLNHAIIFHEHRLRRGADHGGGTGFRHRMDLDSDGRGVLDRLAKPAERRGVSLVLGIGEDAWGYQDHFHGYTNIGMVDPCGRTHRQSCVNNPRWRQFQVASIEDIVREHSFLSGMMFMHERSGPLSAVLYGAGYGDGRNGYCFCEHCRRLGRQRGLDAERAREGYRKLQALVDRAVAGEDRPADGWFVSIWRLLQRYHEILAWDQLWWDCIHDYRAAVVGAAKAVRRDVHVGYHFQHATLMLHVLWRAGDDPARVIEYADWIKHSVYPGCSGGRSRNQVHKAQEAWLADLPLSAAHEFICWVMGHDPAGLPDPLAEQGQFAWPAEWARRETARLVAGCDPKPVYAGLGIGVPGGGAADTAECVTACAEACYDGGASGLLLSRHYDEMRADLLDAAGDVIRRHMG
jgi:hypothetical protein